jgi:hypothetical protein
MAQPSTPQMRVLLAAVRNGGRVPSNAFAYAGYFPAARGCERIVGVLNRAAKASTQNTCEEVLLDGLDSCQLLMAGGFLGVERNSFHDGRGDLAERYATAIRSKAGRIEGTSVAGIRACIRAGWLTDRWEITTEGRDAARLTDPDGYAQTLPADQVTDELDRVVISVSDINRMMRKSATDIAARRTAGREDAPAAPTFVVDEAHRPAVGGKTAEVRSMLDEIMRPGRRGPGKTLRVSTDMAQALSAGYTVMVFDPKNDGDIAAIRAAMAGYDQGELTPAERAAADRGISPVAYRRLYPAVTGDLADELLPRITVLRDDLVRRLVDTGHELAAVTVAGDPREAGYRVALTTVRRDTQHGEAIRKAMFHLELALTAIENGHGGVAGGCLAKASAALAR